MAKLPKHYSLVQEHPHSYLIHDSRDNNQFHVAKHDLDLGMHANLATLPKYSEGTPDGEVASAGDSEANKINFDDAVAANISATGRKPINVEPAPISAGTPIPDNGVPPYLAANSSSAPMSVNVSPQDISTGGYQDMPAVSTAPAPKQALDPFQMEKKSLQERATALGTQGASESKALTDTGNDVNELPTENELVQQNRVKQNKLFSDYQNENIDPDRYINSMSTGNKIAAGIGMLFSGIGSGLTGQPNMAMQIMQDAISRDIDAQKQNKSSKYNLWRMNRENLSTDIQANAATEAQMYTALKYKLMKAQAQATGPLAQANATQAIAQVDQRLALLNLKSAALAPAQRTEQDQVNNMNRMRVLDPEAYKSMNDTYLPGVGISKVPLTKEDREEFRSYDELNKSINDAKAFAQQTGTTLGVGGWGSSQEGVAQSKRTAIMLELNKLHGLNRLNEAEFKAYSDAVMSPGAWNTGKAIAKLDELKNQIEVHRKSQLRGLGIVPFTQAPQDAQAISWARQNPNDPRAQQILQTNGVR